MTKTQPTKGSKKGKGGRKKVAFVEHPDTGLAVQGLRIHKSSSRYYRIIDGKKDRHYYPKDGRKGLSYLRRAIYEHLCHREGQAPEDSFQVVVTEPAHDDWGDEIPVIGSFDDIGRPVNIVYVGKRDLAMHVRKQLDNPATRKEFAELIGIPELQNLHSLPAIATPLTLAEIIDRYSTDKTFAYKRQTKDAQTFWALFVESVGVDTLEDITNAALQRYKKVVEEKYTLRTQKNHLEGIQSILTHASAVFKAHRELIQSQKLEFKLNCQNWSQDKKRKAKRSKAKPMKPVTFRSMLAQAKKHSKLATAMYYCGANFAMHGKEVTDIRHEDLDFEADFLSSYREKDGVQRVAWIWKETKTAIKSYLNSDEYHHHKEFIFTDHNGKLLNIQKVVRMNRKLREDAELLDSVVFDGIRSMTSTAMGAENILAQKWVMGHTTGQLDTYTLRDEEKGETKKALTKARKAILGS